MLSWLPDLQKERGFPHPSRKKKLLQLKRESTRLRGILLEYFTHLRSGLRPFARYAGYDAARVTQRRPGEAAGKLAVVGL
jgi:hypothetical protein